MPLHIKWDLIKEIVCFCACLKRGKSHNRNEAHLYCGCKESNKSKNTKSASGNDTGTGSVVENEALDDVLQADDIGEYLIKETAAPCNRVLQSPLQPQSDILVHGTLTDQARSFAINLIVARNSKEDIAFHFNPDLRMHYSVRNSRLKEKWNVEEVINESKFPFQQGRPFVMEIFLTHHAFMVAVNGIHYCSYRYRTFLLKISSLEISGDVYLSSVQVTDSAEYPSPSNLLLSPHFRQLNLPGLTKFEAQRTPIYGALNNCRLKEGCRIEINGRVILSPVSFIISLQEGSRVWPHPEIPLQVSVRFYKEVYINSYHEGGWSKKAQKLPPGEFPFVPGDDFKLEIECGSDAYTIKIRNITVSTFKYQVPCSLVDTIHINGDVKIHDINLSLR